MGVCLSVPLAEPTAHTNDAACHPPLPHEKTLSWQRQQQQQQQASSKQQQQARQQRQQLKATSDSIDRTMAQAKLRDELKMKLLLLGAGESGKSTIFKQMRILHGAPPSDEDLRMYGVIVRSNCVTAMRKLCGLLRSLNLEDQLSQEPTEANGPYSSGLTPQEAFDLLYSVLVEGASTRDLSTPLLLAGEEEEERDWVGCSPRAVPRANDDAKLFLQLWKPIRTLWETRTMRKVWAKRASVNVVDGHKAFLQDCARIAAPSFRPTQQDILLARLKTTQVVKENYHIDGIEFEMWDLGGQRSERKKWFDCFDNVDAVIFVAALSEYDQSLAEAKGRHKKNRMVEALELFRTVCYNRAFANTCIMLFLNKKDIFAEKVLESDIAAQPPFSNYCGPPRDFNSGVLYFIQRFKDILENGRNDFNDNFIHVTCATDTNNMEFVVDSARTIVVAESLKRSGLFGAP